MFDEAALQAGFVTALKSIMEIDSNLINSFMKSTKEVIGNGNHQKKLLDLNDSIKNLKDRQAKLIDLMLDETISKDDYGIKSNELTNLILTKEKEINQIEELVSNQESLETKLQEIKDKILESDTIVIYDPEIFTLLIDRVIVGGHDSLENKVPEQVTYIFDITNEAFRIKGKKDKDYTIISTMNCQYSYHTFSQNEYGYRTRVKHDSFPIQIAIKNK